jgi:hypothetical protein
MIRSDGPGSSARTSFSARLFSPAAAFVVAKREKRTSPRAASLESLTGSSLGSGEGRGNIFFALFDHAFERTASHVKIARAEEQESPFKRRVLKGGIGFESNAKIVTKEKTSLYFISTLHFSRNRVPDLGFSRFFSTANPADHKRLATCRQV